MLALTLWPISEWEKAVPMIRAIRPDAIQLHADPDTLVKSLATVKAKLIAALGDAAPREWWVGIAGDVGRSAPPAKLWALREKGLHAAKAIGATRVVLNCEAAWKLDLPGFLAADARRWVALAKQVCGVPVYVTSFDCPAYHSKLPWAAFDDADGGWMPQIYAAPAKGQPGRKSKQGRARLKLHQEKWAQATRLGWLKPRPVCAYVQAHHVVDRETMWILDAHDEVCFWALSTRVDADGVRAARAFTELERRGFRGVGRVRRFQAANGLVVDGLCGPKTFEALGL